MFSVFFPERVVVVVLMRENDSRYSNQRSEKSNQRGALLKCLTSDGEMQLSLCSSNCQSGLVSGNENDENGCNELMEHRLRSTLSLGFKFSFICFMVLMPS